MQISLNQIKQYILSTQAITLIESGGGWGHAELEDYDLFF